VRRSTTPSRAARGWADSSGAPRVFFKDKVTGGLSHQRAKIDRIERAFPEQQPALSA